MYTDLDRQVYAQLLRCNQNFIPTTLYHNLGDIVPILSQRNLIFWLS